MENQLNQTQSAPPTSNPQSATSPNGASESTDFQSTAPSDALNQEAEQLSVQETGEPIYGSEQAIPDNAVSVIWIGIVLAIVVVGVWFLAKLLRESVDDNKRPAAKPAASPATKAKSTKKKPVAKKTTKKKSAPNQRRKKTTKKKR